MEENSFFFFSLCHSQKDFRYKKYTFNILITQDYQYQKDLGH